MSGRACQGLVQGAALLVLAALGGSAARAGGRVAGAAERADAHAGARDASPMA